MILNMLTIVSLAAACGWAQAPDGRWDGTITYGALNVPFIIHFEPNGKNLTGSFVNGDTRANPKVSPAQLERSWQKKRR